MSWAALWQRDIPKSAKTSRAPRKCLILLGQPAYAGRVDIERNQIARSMRDVRNAAGQRRETPYGVLYSPKTFGLQVLVLVGAFAGGPVIGWLTARTGRSVFDRGGDSLCPADVDLLFRIRPLVTAGGNPYPRRPPFALRAEPSLR